MDDFILREVHILQLDYCTKKFIQTFINTDCRDCYEECEKTHDDIFKCISDHFYNILIVNDFNGGVISDD